MLTTTFQGPSHSTPALSGEEARRKHAAEVAKRKKHKELVKENVEVSENDQVTH